MSDSPILEVRLERFRCFRDASFQPGPGINVIAGANASGKTSVLEALFFLGRGTSFRAARTDTAVQFGAEDFVVFGLLGDRTAASRVGVSVSRAAGLAVRLDGAPGARADLARALPVQILDPNSHELIAGPPAARRQFLDWCVFHVEHEFLEAWQRYRRALQQRNAALRAGNLPAAWAYDESLAVAGATVDRCRGAALQRLLPGVQRYAGTLLDAVVDIGYSSGWQEGTDLATAIHQGHDRDMQQGSSTVGPHRADLRISISSRRARETVSRGQEKLLAAALILGEVEAVSAVVGRRVVLLVDEPGADLDRNHRQRLQATVGESKAQAFVTVLDPDQFPADSSARRFHVEHGGIHPLL